MTEKPGTVLLVDDEPLLRAVMADALVEDGGFDVVEVGTAEEALEALEQHPARVLITDVMMPGSIDGITLAKTVAQRWPETAIIVISGWRGPKTGEVPQTAAFLAKPFRPSELLRVVTKVIASDELPEPSAGAAFLPTGVKLDQLHTGIGPAGGLAQLLQEPDE
jgi:DNA-binding NtrC family response regulator